MPATSTTLRGLIQALGGARPRSSQRGDRPPSGIATRRARRPHTPCSLKAAALRLWSHTLAREKLAGAQNQFCAARPGWLS